jgi:membrane protease YdiL (CAAX protease family)
MTQSVPPRPDIPNDAEGEPIIPATWRPIEALPVFFIAFIAAGLLGSLVSVMRSCSARNVLIAFVGEIAFGGTVIWWVSKVNRTSLRALGAPRRPWGDLLAGALTGLALVVVAGVVLAVVRAAATEIIGHTPEEPEQVAACVRGVGLALLGPVVIVAAPVGEELFFRGFLYQGLRRRFSVWPAAIVSGVVFGLVHVRVDDLRSFLIVPSLTAVGVGLALVFERRHSLLASMSAHAAFNVVGYVAIVLSR